MELEKQELIENYIRAELLQLNFKRLIIKKACKNFEISEEDALHLYNSVKPTLKKDAINRALIYLILGSISLFIGITGTFGNTGFIFWGALLVGTGSLITSLGLFKLALLKN